MADDVLTLPRLGESIVEATIVRWRVKPGERVRAGDVLVEVETDKATNEIPAPRDGVIEHLEAEEGETLPVGAPLLRYVSSGGGGAESNAETPAPAAPREPSGHRSRLAPRPRDGAGYPRPCSPSARRAARLHGVDLARVRGRGRSGRVRRDDVLAHIRASAATQQAAGDRVVRLEGRRRAIADALAAAQRDAVQVFALTEIDLARVEARRAEASARGVRLSHLPFIVRAVARAMEACPELNATLVGDEIRVHRAKNIGIAVDTEHGLVVPVVHHADRYHLEGLRDRIAELAEGARARTLTSEDLAGGTFTISNPGREGNLVGVSVLRAPEVGILRTGAVTKRPVVRTIDGEDHVVIRPVMMAALTYDHRAIDGKTGNRFLSAIRDALETWGDDAGAQPG